MTSIRTSKDPVTRTLTVVADLEASADRVFALWRDPRMLERWWGPPTFPATFTRHEFFVGGECRYHMTGPAGETPHGWWRIEAIDEPKRIEFLNGLAGADGEPVPGVAPMVATVTFEPAGTGTRMTVVSRFEDDAQMARMLEMGMEEGMAAAVGQIGSLLDHA